MHRTNISVIIPTKDRTNDVEGLLRMLYDQTISPMEIIVVDDSVGDKTEKIVLNFQRKFAEKGTEIKYIRGGGEGISHARNLGFSHSTGEICLFLDDDIIINKCYIEEILKVYRSFPNVLGVSGYILNWFSPFSALRNAITKLFYGVYGLPNKCQVRPLGMSYPCRLDKVINCEWLSGTNCSYRRSVLEVFKWDENLKRYSLCEDKDLSYRIHKRFPNSLFLTPYARVIHKASPSGRLSDKYVIYSGTAYSTYIYFKNWKQTIRNMVIFVWGMFFGYLMLRILTGNPKLVIYQIDAYLHLLRNFEEIRNGNLTYLEKIKLA
ncbi:MAG: glycosyltransferase [Candidatus Bathyarchaeia archaeon]